MIKSGSPTDWTVAVKRTGFWYLGYYDRSVLYFIL